MIIAIGDIHGEFKEMQSKMVEIMESASEPVNFVQVYKINPNFSWYHGHYHESHVTNNDGQVVHSLSILEFKEVR